MILNRNKLLVTLFIGIFCLSCTQPPKKINPIARKLNDSAIRFAYNLQYPNDKYRIITAINLLNQAIKIDSTYYNAYNNKLMLQFASNQYESALLTAKQMVKLRPNNPDIKETVGIIYERKGDTLLAFKYYDSSLMAYNKILDTMSNKNNYYKSLEMSKAIALIFLNKQKEGYAIFKDLYTKEKDPTFKEGLKMYLNMTRHDFLYPESKINKENANPVTR